MTIGVIGEGIVVGNNCTFGAGTKLHSPFVVEEHSVFFGDPIRHRICLDKPPVVSRNIYTIILIHQMFL